MISRRHLLVGGAMALALPLAGEAQQVSRIPRVGFLVMAQNPGVEEWFPRGLRALGYVEGRDVVGVAVR